MKCFLVTHNGKQSYATASKYFDTKLRKNRWFFRFKSQSDFFDTQQEGIDWIVSL